ncbi:hypothetical protein E7T06_07385 [Deinococcus sp. Arct2-2]|uniref:hypothetical protein n=1 Tax=Deinococcus sp. Arct2-2 TaxID=2568653 RepID=UPI0010A32C70|nr:hypothetical protein [Deinococcus sp. Arct2-2]THF70518.1 hypothetical protein E7T06_07385 [Deinococcus sp. Arct2-2]
MSDLPFTKPDGSPLPHLTNARLTTDKKTLILFIQDNGTHYTRRIDMRRSGAGLSNFTEYCGHLMFARGVKDYPPTDATPWIHTIRDVVGVFTARRDLAEALVFFLWGEEVSLTQWPEPEGVPAVQSLAEAAD